MSPASVPALLLALPSLEPTHATLDPTSSQAISLVFSYNRSYWGVKSIQFAWEGA